MHERKTSVHAFTTKSAMRSEFSMAGRMCQRLPGSGYDLEIMTLDPIHLDLLGISKLSFGVPVAHTLTTTASTLDSTQDAINVCGATPLLMRQHIDT